MYVEQFLVKFQKNRSDIRAIGTFRRGDRMTINNSQVMQESIWWR